MLAAPLSERWGTAYMAQVILSRDFERMPTDNDDCEDDDGAWMSDASVANHSVP